MSLLRLVLATLVLSAPPARAQPPAYSLDEALAYAREHQPRAT
jgi:hypothetical protein